MQTSIHSLYSPAIRDSMHEYHIVNMLERDIFSFCISIAVFNCSAGVGASSKGAGITKIKVVMFAYISNIHVHR